jgi:hypothetical protein
MSRRLLAWPLWGITTAVATTVCWAGVSVVTASITATHTPALPARDIHAALDAPVPPEGREPGTSALSGPQTTAALPGVAAPPGSVAAPASLGGRSPATAGGPTGTPAPSPPAIAQSSSAGNGPIPPLAAAVGSPAPPPASPPVVAPPSVLNNPGPPPAPASSGTGADSGDNSTSSSSTSTSPSSTPQSPAGSGPIGATFSTQGGTVTVSCQGSTISLVSASPADGYTLAVRSSGPQFVDVDFNGQPSGSAVRAYCNRNGQPTRITDE